MYGDVVGTWKARAPMWRALSKSAAASGKPFVWGGDWNTTEDEVTEIIGSMNLPGVSSVPVRSTCVTQGGGSVIDFFVMHKKCCLGVKRSRYTRRAIPPRIDRSKWASRVSRSAGN